MSTSRPLTERLAAFLAIRMMPLREREREYEAFERRIATHEAATDAFVASGDVLRLRDIATSDRDGGEWLDTYCDLLEEKYVRTNDTFELKLEPLDRAAIVALREAATPSAVQTVALALAEILGEHIRSALHRRFRVHPN